MTDIFQGAESLSATTGALGRAGLCGLRSYLDALEFLFLNFLRFVVALDDRRIVRHRNAVQLGEIRCIGTIPSPLKFAEHGIGTGRNDTSLLKASDRSSRCHRARV